ncbi:HK97 family phage major capsid protein [Hasllibacter halocynthiae]|uniref:HK97 family phage major capsid protein n=1 Tax=Hasllibacter halocynthiae TaxID=595589 RepID=A0A2T0X8X0_9RHOB|nr:phage major capsid protein [Hasllibacter halocynthiae]PRY95369.1 HK97 family phage major capsid protein [Hasllibacter halocynthiae]
MSDEIGGALRAFAEDVKGFKREVEAKIGEQERRMSVMNKMGAGRPVLSTKAAEADGHRDAMGAYLRQGDDEGLRALAVERKGMSTAVSADGGYLVDPATSETVRSVLAETASIRAVASVVEVDATSYDVLVDHGEMGSVWASEAGSMAETGAGAVDRVSIPLHELSALPKCSQRLLDDAAFDMEAWLSQRIAERFARAEAAAFVAGDGVDKPTGFLTKPTVDDGVWSWGSIGTVPTGEDGGLGDGAAIVALVYALGAQYRANGTFVMNSRTAGAVRQLKDGEGRFLWLDGMGADQPARLMGYPVLIAEDMPDMATGATPVAFGDFASGYTIAERADLRVLRDPFSAKPNVLFYATKRVGGDVTDFAAIKLLATVQ